MDKNKKDFVIRNLRRISLKWPPRTRALQKARVGRNQYQCAICKLIVTNKEKQLDHIEPVVDPNKGQTTLDEYVDRLFCYEAGFQVLCLDCHNDKSQKENKERN